MSRSGRAEGYGPPELEQVLGAHRRASERFVELVRTMGDSARPVPHLEWSVGEVARHVLANFRGHVRALDDGEPLWRSLDDPAAENARNLAAVPEQRPAELAFALAHAGERLRAALLHQGDVPFAALADVKLRPTTVAGVNTGDVLVHGWDIAQATGSGWDLPRDDCALVAASMIPAAAAFLDEESARGFRARYELRIRGGPTFALRVHDGTLDAAIEPFPKADCRMSVDPAAFLLSSFNRVPRWKVALAGKSAAWGRKPWLALRFPSLLRQV